MPVQQHPIPQNVTSYQFRLVGDMTLKQFLQVAAGVVIGVIIYAMPLPAFFKWPLVAFSVGLGAAIAFLPIQGRPLDQWLLAFIRSIYAPTIYTWHKPGEPKTGTLDHTPTTAFTQALQTAQSAPPPTTTKTPSTTKPLESIESSQSSSQQIADERPDLVPKIHTLTRSTPPPTTPSPQPEAFISTSKGIARSPKNVYTSKPKPLKIEKQPRKDANTIKSPAKSPSTPIPTDTSSSAKPGTSASFSSELPIPHSPQTPNTVVGMTLDHQGKILESAIIEILKNGQTIRATKSNKLGQFLFAKPLDDGVYQITADNGSFTFPRFDLKLEGETIQPIRLQATGTK